MSLRMKISLILFSMVISGCKSALLEMKEDNFRIADRVHKKELELALLKEQHQQFLIEKNKLQTMLNQKESTLNDLSVQIERLRVANNQMKVVSDIEQNKKMALSRKLDEYSRKIETLSNDDSQSLEEKRKKIEELKQKMKDLMDVILKTN